jgi:hypothetical protein
MPLETDARLFGGEITTRTQRRGRATEQVEYSVIMGGAINE